MKKYLLFSIILVVTYNETISQVISQERTLRENKDRNKCGTIFNKDAYNSALQLQGQVQALTTSFDSDDVLLIPVVIHKVYSSHFYDISLSNIQYVLNIINEDFARLNPDRTNTPSIFQGVADSPKIQFILATQDPDGNPTSGITDTPNSSVSTFFPADTIHFNNDIKQTSEGGHDAWNTSQYLNIWVTNILGGGGGYSTFPQYYATEPNYQGIVIDYVNFTSETLDEARVVTHELGHYFGLFHIWSSEQYPSGECWEDDGISDTPSQAWYYKGCQGTVSSCGSIDMTMNYMDYTDGSCENLFTIEQSNVMRSSIAPGGLRQDFQAYLPYPVYSGICYGTNSSITISGLPTGATVDSWSITPASYVTVSSGSGSTAVTQPSSQNINDWATINFIVNGGGTDGQNANIQLKIRIGKPEHVNGPISGPTNVTACNLYLYRVPDQNNPSGTFDWRGPRGFTQSAGGAGYNYVQMWVRENAWSGYVQVSRKNVCGNSGAASMYVTTDPDCGGPIELIVSPNPATDEVSIEFANPTELDNYLANIDASNRTINIEIVSIEAEKKFNGVIGKDGLKLNLKDFKRGIYIIKVNNGEVKSEARFLLE
jgi:pregnancy-associated plasma protein-A/type IX secretion system substrate protein/PKD domain-containing protein